jgi:integrase
MMLAMPRRQRCLTSSPHPRQSRGTSSGLTERSWVFASGRTGRPLHAWTAERRWLVPAGRKVGIERVGWHSFRHAYSTLLNEYGTDVKLQLELFRHADIRTTMNITPCST